MKERISHSLEFVLAINMPSVHRMMIIPLTISKVTVVQWSVIPSLKIQLEQTAKTLHAICPFQMIRVFMATKQRML